MKSMFKQRGECHKRFINNIFRIYTYIYRVLLVRWKWEVLSSGNKTDLGGIREGAYKHHHF